MSKTDLAMWQNVLRSKYGIPTTEMDVTIEDDNKSVQALLEEMCELTGVPSPLTTMRQQQQNEVFNHGAR